MPSKISAAHPGIYLVRGRQVMIATHLAPLFGVSPKILNQQIRRNERRFPEDFGFRLTPDEIVNLRLHFEASTSGHGGHRHPPFAVTEYGVVMIANVLNSSRAIAMSVQVVREFIRLRKITRSQDSLKKKLGQLERTVNARLDKHESKIDELFDAVESLIEPPDSESKKPIGFVP